MKKRLILIALCLLCISFATAKEHQVDKSKKNLVKFISDAPIEDFEGVTNNIDGYIFNEADEISGSKLYFEVDLNTLDTDIGLRNRHMRENYLHTDKYPLATFDGNIVESMKVEDKHYIVKAKGKFKVHGIEKEKTIEADLYVYGDIYHVKTKFIVPLTDHNIDVPSVMTIKIDENMDIVLDFFLKEAKK